MASPGPVTQLLARARAGDDEARDELLRLTYDDLRRLARAQLRRERADHTLQPTALVHEVCLHLLGGDEVPGENRAQFLAFVAEAMRHILISHARSRGRAKRGGDAGRIAVEIDRLVGVNSNPDLVALDEALGRLSGIDPRKGRVVELRFFGGMTIEQVAQVLNVSAMTVKRDWEVARTWLLRELSEDGRDVG